MRIFKETLINETGIQRLCLPFDTLEETKKSILKIDMQGETPCMWFNAPEKEKKEFALIAIGTGNDYSYLKQEDYIGSVIAYRGAYV